MTEAKLHSTLKRKAEAGRPRAESSGDAVERAVRQALARGVQAIPGLVVTIARYDAASRSLTELLDMPPERGLIAVLEGPAEGLGMIALGPGVLASVIEVLTTGKVAPGDPVARKPTRTDAAMAAGLIDRTLKGLEEEFARSPELVWAGGFRYASFLDDPRPLGLLLDDAAFRVFRLSVELGAGGRTGEILLALPAQGRGRAPAAAAPAPGNDRAARQAWQAALGEVVMEAPVRMTAVLHRVTIPLSAVMALKAGDLVPVPAAALERIVIEGVGGRRLAEGKLGQNRGNRAVRLVETLLPGAKPAQGKVGTTAAEPKLAARDEPTSLETRAAASAIGPGDTRAPAKKLAAPEIEGETAAAEE